MDIVIPDCMLPPPEAREQIIGDPNLLIPHVYGDFQDPANRQDTHLIERAILTPTNKAVGALNDEAVKRFPGDEHVYASADSAGNEEHAHAYPVEYLNTVEPPAFPPHLLRLKVGIPIMLLRNVNPAQGLANGRGW